MKQAFGTKKNRAKLLKRMWQYMGKNRLMIVLAVLRYSSLYFFSRLFHRLLFDVRSLLITFPVSVR